MAVDEFWGKELARVAILKAGYDGNMKILAAKGRDGKIYGRGADAGYNLDRKPA